ncbi:MAG: hypothetical protein HQL56_02950 [Magnetococcales bacterium]|nr:hypothetical protein [Magnetococcales bacterium]
MNRQQIIERIRLNLSEAGIGEAEVRVQPDPFKGWRVGVVTEGFTGRSMEERRGIVTKGLEELHFEWLDVLIPEEREWAGPLPGDEEPERLPLWPEALGREAPGDEELVPFPTDGDEELAPPIVVTFYSLRGGVGRSTAMAYTAKSLARRGRKVVCVDMDLEAPGLVSLFGLRPEGKYRLREDGKTPRGVVQLLLEIDRGDDPDFSQNLIKIHRFDNLFLLPAGFVDADYARGLRSITPDYWYREDNNPLLTFMGKLQQGLPFVPDVILLDARTGLSEVSGPLLFGLSDMAIITFFPHLQAEQGTRLLTQGLLRSRVRRPGREGKYAPEVRFLVSPVPQSNAPEVKRRYRDLALGWVSDWMAQVSASRVKSGLMELREDEITHFISYREDVATSDRVADSGEMISSYTKLVDWVDALLVYEWERKLEENIKRIKNDNLKGGLIGDTDLFFEGIDTDNIQSCAIGDYISKGEFLSYAYYGRWIQGISIGEWLMNRAYDSNGSRSDNITNKLSLYSWAIEEHLHRQNPYWKSLIRPRSICGALEPTSQYAVDWFRKEHPELGAVLDVLEKIGSTPIRRQDLKEVEEYLEKAMEAGLLRGEFEDRDGNFEIFHVPDLYRIGLKMVRKRLD